jgi:hypothetical protein
VVNGHGAPCGPVDQVAPVFPLDQAGHVAPVAQAPVAHTGQVAPVAPQAGQGNQDGPVAPCCANILQKALTPEG